MALSSALCDSDRARGNGMELSGEGQLGVRERGCSSQLPISGSIGSVSFISLAVALFVHS